MTSKRSVALLLLLALYIIRPVAAQSPSFIATATLTSPNNPSDVKMAWNPPYGFTGVCNIVSANQIVQVSGEPANQSLNLQYDLNINNNGTIIQGDYSSGICYCDANGNWSHYAKGSGSMSGVATCGDTAGHFNTAQAVSDIYNVANTAQRSHAAATASWSVSH